MSDLFKINPLPGPVKLDDIERTGMYTEYLSFLRDSGEYDKARQNIQSESGNSSLTQIVKEASFV